MNVVQGIVGHMTPEVTKLYSNHACLEAKREKMQLLTDFLNLADGAEPQPLGDCSHDPEIIALLKKIPRRYADEVKQVLEVMSTASPRDIVEMRRQLTS